MTDSPDPAESPEIEEVRRLLADTRHLEPMPDDIVARMDDVIDGLRETPAGDAAASGSVPADPDDTVVPLAAHRRRRAAGMLVAAAAVVVGGVVVAQNLPQPSSSSSVSGGSAAAPDRGQGSLGVQRSPGAESFGDNSARSTLSPVVRHGRLVVHPQHFSVDALAGRRLLQRYASADSLTTQQLTRCPSVPTGHGEVLRATYLRAPAALVYRSASGGSQVVDLYLCGNGHPVRSATLPAP